MEQESEPPDVAGAAADSSTVPAPEQELDDSFPHTGANASTAGWRKRWSDASKSKACRVETSPEEDSEVDFFGGIGSAEPGDGLHSDKFLQIVENFGKSHSGIWPHAREV